MAKILIRLVLHDKSYNSKACQHSWESAKDRQVGTPANYAGVGGTLYNRIIIREIGGAFRLSIIRKERHHEISAHIRRH